MLDLQTIGIIAALGSAASWAIGAFLFKKLGESLSPLAMTLIKGILSLIVLGAAVACTGVQSMDASAMGLLALSGLLGIALGDTLFFAALRLIQPHTLLVLGVLGQVLTVAMAVVFLGEFPGWATWLGVALILVGVAAVIESSIASEERAVRMRGIGWGLLFVVCMSTSTIFAKPALDRLPNDLATLLLATIVRMGTGTLGLLAFGLVTRSLGSWIVPFHDRRLFVSFFLAVCVITFGGFWLSLVALKYADVIIANALLSTEPVMALILGVICFKERFTWQAKWGTVATMAGVTSLIVGSAK